MKTGEDREILNKIGLDNEAMAKIYGFKTVRAFNVSRRRESLQIGAAEIVRKVAQHLLNKK